MKGNFKGNVSPVYWGDRRKIILETYLPPPPLINPLPRPQIVFQWDAFDYWRTRLLQPILAPVVTPDSPTTLARERFFQQLDQYDYWRPQTKYPIPTPVVVEVYPYQIRPSVWAVPDLFDYWRPVIGFPISVLVTPFPYPTRLQLWQQPTVEFDYRSKTYAPIPSLDYPNPTAPASWVPTHVGPAGEFYSWLVSRPNAAVVQAGAAFTFAGTRYVSVAEVEPTLTQWVRPLPFPGEPPPPVVDNPATRFPDQRYYDQPSYDVIWWQQHRLWPEPVASVQITVSELLQWEGVTNIQISWAGKTNLQIEW